MKYKNLKQGKRCSVGIDEVRNEAVFETRKGFCDGAPAYYPITLKELSSFPDWPEGKLEEILSREPLCLHDLAAASEAQLCRLYERKAGGPCAILQVGETTLLKYPNRYCIKKARFNKMPYNVLPIQGQDHSIPGEIAEKIMRGLDFEAPLRSFIRSHQTRFTLEKV